jgi:hypothetical protein
VSRWVDWHRAYDDPDGPLARRLVIVQDAIARALDGMPPGPIRVVSFCSGDGRDLLEVVARHPRGADVTGRLVELDPELAARARTAAPPGIEVAGASASTTTAFEGAVPADLVLACGVFGNVREADIVRTIELLPSLCAPGATVVWTRHRRPPDATILARDTFAAAGFAEVDFSAPEGFLFAVGVHRLVGAPAPFRAGVEMFEFVGFDGLADRCPECGFAYMLLPAEIVERLVVDAGAFAARLHALDDAAARRRPSPDVWSPLEYACHVRDMLRVQTERVERVAREHEPELAPMGRDERAVADRYNEQDPREVAPALLDAARNLSARLSGLDDAGWLRVAIYSYPVRARRTLEWIGNHTVHELVHHAGDVGGPPG